MSTLDMIVVGVIVLCGLLGIYWGFIRQVLSVVGLVAGLALANRYGGPAADALSSLVSNESLARVLGFVLVLVAVSAVASLLATLLRRFVGLLFLGWLDHLIGGVLGLAQGALVSTVLLMLIGLVSAEFFTTALSSSRVAPQLVQALGGIVKVFLPGPLQVSVQRLLSGG